jgi:hypothetical protein
MGADPDRKKIALVASAHHLARVMGAMLRSGECWRESIQCQNKAAAISPPEDTAPLTALSSGLELATQS